MRQNVRNTDKLSTKNLGKTKTNQNQQTKNAGFWFTLCFCASVLLCTTWNACSLYSLVVWYELVYETQNMKI